MGWGLIGNERAVAALQRALAGGTLAHAYLFVGPARVGKATLAIKLAQALNCTADAALSQSAATAGAVTYGGASEPCGECQPCRRIAAGIHSDVPLITVQPADEGLQHKAISVGQMRDVERAVALNPFEGRTRVIIIDPADAMNVEAQNAFLKTLEEPPPNVVFVLVAAGEERLLPTVRSRCRRVEFRLPPVTDVERGLREAGAGPEQARLLARLSRGRAGWALEMARDPPGLERRRQALDSARAPVDMTVAQRLATAEAMAADFRRDREAVLALLAEWQGWWRDVLLIGSGAETGVANLDMLSELREDARRCSRSAVAGFVRALGAARRHLEENVQPRLALEALLLDVPGAALISLG